MSDCYCDVGDGYPDVYRKETRTARVQHRCYECGKAIKTGERYEYTASLFDGSWTIAKTCCRCLDVREYVTAHAPCFCWLHGSMLDEAREAANDYGRYSAGFYIGTMKRVLRAERAL